MKRGKHICETLKGIRADIARANEIDYHPAECTHEGDCAGTCPACESEMRWLERHLRLRQHLGKAVTIAGLSLGAGALLSSCNLIGNHTAGKAEVLEGAVSNPNNVDSTEIEPLAGDVVMPDSLEPYEVGQGDTDTLANPPQEKPQKTPRQTAGLVRPHKPKPDKDGEKPE